MFVQMLQFVVTIKANTFANHTELFVGCSVMLTRNFDDLIHLVTVVAMSINFSAIFLYVEVFRV